MLLIRMIIEFSSTTNFLISTNIFLIVQLINTNNIIEIGNIIY